VLLWNKNERVRIKIPYVSTSHVYVVTLHHVHLFIKAVRYNPYNPSAWPLVLTKELPITELYKAQKVKPNMEKIEGISVRPFQSPYVRGQLIYIPSFTSWKYSYHCTHKHSLFVLYNTKID
jgi:hypothetical protein